MRSNRSIRICIYLSISDMIRAKANAAVEDYDNWWREVPSFQIGANAVYPRLMAVDFFVALYTMYIHMYVRRYNLILTRPQFLGGLQCLELGRYIAFWFVAV